MKKRLSVKEKHEKKMLAIRKKIEQEKKLSKEAQAEKNYLIELLHEGNRALKGVL